MASRPEVGINDLPNEILVSIFSELTVTDLGWCAATCRRWHALVSGFTSLWRGKFYVCNRSPRACVETQAVLHALPPSLELLIEVGESFSFDILYPRAVLSVTHLWILHECPRLKCSYLATRVDFAGDIVTYRTVVDFEVLRKLRILRIRRTNAWSTHSYSEDYVVGTALQAFPNLTELYIGAEALSADYLDAMRGFAQLRVLEIECPGLERLTFLRHCADSLEELQLLDCAGLPSRQYRQLRQLRRLRKLRLRDCRPEEEDLAAALEGAAGLESLRLHRSVAVRDLSLVRPCGRLREMCVASSPAPDVPLPLLPAGRHPQLQAQLRHLRPPTQLLDGSARVVGFSLGAAGVWEVLPRLADLGLAGDCLQYLAPLRHCPQLRHFCCEFAREPEHPDLPNVRLQVSFANAP